MANRIARIKPYFIEDNAESLNGRMYPKEAVDTLLSSIHRRLADPNALPMTCYLSHDLADSGSIPHLVGKVTDAGREGAKGYVWIDVPDTRAGHEIVTLAKGGYIKSHSLRATGNTMSTRKGVSVPVVGGNLQFEGIDWTTQPGLAQVARIADITESTRVVREAFHASPFPSIIKEKSMPRPKSQSLEEVLCEGIRTGDISVILDRRQPLPDFMQNNLEETLKIMSKQLLGLMDYTYGLGGGVPQRFQRR